MANDNHEYYDSEEICTYTDAITVSNPLTEEQVNAAVLSAGVPYDAANAWIKVETSAALDEPNSNNPFENGPSGLAVIHETSALLEIPVTNYERYYHVIYRASSAVATALSVKKYRNVLTVNPRTATIGAATVNFYEWTITTQYGEDNNWTNSVLSPQRVINVSGDLSTIPMSGHHDQIFGQSEFSGLGGRFVIGKYITALSAMSGSTTTPTTAPYIQASDWDYTLQSQTDYHVSHNTYYDKWVIGHDQGGGGGFHAYGLILITSLDFILMQCAICGLKFHYDGTDYKPIVSGGVVTGYTSDMAEESEWDDWENIGDHTIPIDPTPVPPPPPGADDDNTDPISTTGAPFAKGLVNYYALTAGSVLIDHISAALSTWDLKNTGKDLYKNLVSCKLVKPPAAIPTTGSEPFTIYGEKPQYEGADITLPVVSGNPDATFGPYTISRKFYDFRDYAPYTRVCIYIPYCGWCDLPSHVVGRSVTVKYFTDIIAATVRAVVFCGNNIVAEAAGVMGLDIPFTADAVGMKQAGVVSGLTAYAGGALQTAAGVASIITTKGGKGIGETLSGASKLVSAYTQTAIAFNENTTEISGKNGDGCCLSGATNIIIKIIRPKYGASGESPFVPAGFAHAVGFVSNKQVRVGNVSGLLIADNVDTSGISGATEAERAEIKRVLETGLIVNAAPE